MNAFPKIQILAVALLAMFMLACAGDGSSAPRLANLTAEEAAQLARWDQERITSIADQLAPAINDVYVSVNTLKTGAQVGSGQANAFLRLKDRVRVARNESRHLATQLNDGKGRVDTVHTYMRLMEIIRDARDDGQKMFIEEPTLDKIAVAADLLRRLSPYYDPQANANPSS